MKNREFKDAASLVIMIVEVDAISSNRMVDQSLYYYCNTISILDVHIERSSEPT